jgi:hypothetical protein
MSILCGCRDLARIRRCAIWPSSFCSCWRPLPDSPVPAAPALWWPNPCSSSTRRWSSIVLRKRSPNLRPSDRVTIATGPVDERSRFRRENQPFVHPNRQWLPKTRRQPQIRRDRVFGRHNMARPAAANFSINNVWVSQGRPRQQPLEAGFRLRGRGIALCLSEPVRQPVPSGENQVHQPSLMIAGEGCPL